MALKRMTKSKSKRRSSVKGRTTGTKRKSRLRGIKPSDITRRKESMQKRKEKMTIYQMKPIPGQKRFVSSFAKKTGGYLSPHSTKQMWLVTLPRKKTTLEKVRKFKTQLRKRL